MYADKRVPINSVSHNIQPFPINNPSLDTDQYSSQLFYAL